MQRASLLAYYDTLLEMGGDDVQQLCDAGEEEFLEIMALVGMASKPLHVRRLQKALQEWITNPAMFQTPLSSGLVPTTNNITHVVNRPLNSVVTNVTTTGTSAINLSSTPLNTQNVSNPTKEVVPVVVSSQDSFQVASEVNNQREAIIRGPSPSPTILNQPPGSPSNQNPVLSECQIIKLSEAAEALVKTLPQFEPKPQNAKKKICRNLEKVMKMSRDDPQRMDEIRKYSAIYGRFDCKRNPQKPLTFHEFRLSKKAAQICKISPALLTRRDDLFALARQIVRDSGYHVTKGHSSFVAGGKSFSYQLNYKTQEDNNINCPKKIRVVDDESSSSSLNDSNFEFDKIKRQDRLDQIAEELRILGSKTEELVQAAQEIRQKNDVSSAQTLQQQMEMVQNKQTQLLLEQSELLKQPLPSRFYRRNGNKNQTENDKQPDTDDTDSQFSLSNASSPSQEVGDSRDSLLRDVDNYNSNGSPSTIKTPCKVGKQEFLRGEENDCDVVKGTYRDETYGFYS
ncbi:conserved hypothetical protein [Pediculus humanus corporis]|uniref:NGFI-A-binding protein n=1 Tax=Pediculus humanus subsp. corporis TaxID=121224 RepID=E0W121_PEDHC|nr:uncharacterized protein Phum_PHUM567510 [Pediculus humanus corporis]EEB19327.1 conserved hypothetical protein [Pediculus humanus corporis]